MQSARSGHSRFLHLDGLRGIAAMVVLVHHCVLTFPAGYSVYLSGPSSISTAIFVFSPLHLLWAGHAAVMVFFALSGFVLALMLLRTPRMGYGAFAVKRLCRIYLPCIAVVAVALAAMSATVPHGMPHLSPWFNTSWTGGVDKRLLLDHVLLMGRPGYNYVDNPIWSLVHEVRYSLAFPLILWIASKARASVAFALSMMASLAAAVGLHRLALWNPILDSLQYAFPFVAGAVLAVRLSTVQAWYRRQSRGIRVCLALLSIVLLTSDGLAYSPLRWVRWAVVLGTYSGSVLLLLCILGAQRGRALLETRFVLWLGRISYSLYLSHLVVLLTLVYTFRKFPVGYVVAFVPAAAIIVAAGLYYSLEHPSIALGARLHDAIERGRDARAAQRERVYT